jgi:hypothetical protein
MSERSQKIQLLSRLNRRRLNLSHFLEELCQALDSPVESVSIVDLQQTDALITLFRQAYQNAISGDIISYRRFFERREEQLVFHLADCIAKQLKNEYCYAFTKQSEDCGAFESNVANLLKRTIEMIEFDGDSISVLSLDLSQGILIDRNEGDSTHAYEVAIWGDRWPLVALACSSHAESYSDAC